MHIYWRAERRRLDCQGNVVDIIARHKRQRRPDGLQLPRDTTNTQIELPVASEARRIHELRFGASRRPAVWPSAREQRADAWSVAAARN